MSRLASTVLAAAALSGPTLAQEGGLASFLDVVEVQVVNVDVVVLDAEGYPLRGLEEEDFELYEDGERVELSNFAAYDETLATVRGLDEPGTAQMPGEPPEGPDAKGPQHPPPVTWLIYVDQSRLDPGPRTRVLRQTQEFLARARRPGERAMVATWDGQHLRRVTDLSDDLRATRGALAALEREIAPAAAARNQAILLQRELSEYTAPSLRGAATASEAALGGLGTTSLIESLRVRIDTIAGEEARKTGAALDAFRDLLVMTNALEGRVAILFVGGGFDLDPGDAYNQLWATPVAGVRAANLAQEYARLLETVNGGRATVYTISAGDHRELKGTADKHFSSNFFAEAATVGGETDATSNLDVFAAETGGRRFRGAAGLVGELEALHSDLRTYYSLGYQPEPARPPAFHRLEVRVRREGVRVLHRSGVALFGPGEDVGGEALLALVGAPPLPVPGREIEIGESRPAPRRSERLVPVVVRLPIREITLLPAGSVHRGALSLHYAVESPDGEMSRFESREMQVEIPNEELAAALEKQVRYSVELQVREGRHRVGVAIRDEVGGGYFTLVAPIEPAAAR